MHPETEEQKEARSGRIRPGDSGAKKDTMSRVTALCGFGNGESVSRYFACLAGPKKRTGWIDRETREKTRKQEWTIIFLFRRAQRT